LDRSEVHQTALVGEDDDPPAVGDGGLGEQVAQPAAQVVQLPDER
jgi:hypothetical protein